MTRSWVSIPVYLILLSMGSGVGVFGHFLRHLCSTTFHSRYIPVSRLAGTVGEPLFKGSPLLSNWTGSSKLNQKEVCFEPLRHIVGRSQGSAQSGQVSLTFQRILMLRKRLRRFGGMASLGPPSPSDSVLQAPRRLTVAVVFSIALCPSVWCTGGVLSLVSCLSTPCKQHFV